MTSNEPAGLRSQTWRRFLSAPDPSLVRELYEPGLSRSIRYDRCCAYFSSSVLAAAARGFGPLIERLLAMGDSAPRPAIRLLVNEELQDADVKALVERGDTSALEELLTQRLGTPQTALEQRRFEMLTFLVARGLLELRVGVMRHSLGQLHAKYGLMIDESGDAVVFRGSGNETATGLRGNYEKLEITTSWQDPEGYEHFRDDFERLWRNEDPDVRTVPLPQALTEQLIKSAPVEVPPREEPIHRATMEASMRWQFISAAPYLIGQAGLDACDATAFVSPWPHQRRVVQETVEAWPDGRLLCDEVGMGKTIEAILILRRLLHGRGVKRVLFLLPAGLMSQWQDELREKGGMLVPRYEGNQLVWFDGSSRAVDGLAEALREPLVIVSRELARLDQHRAAIMNADPWDLVLVDETHAARRARQEETEFNSPTLLLGLLRDLQLKQQTKSFLLLSATPMQTHPWEPFDLLQVLGEGGEWLADFGSIRTYYGAAGTLVRGAPCDTEVAAKTARLVCLDGRYAPPPNPLGVLSTDEAQLGQALEWALTPERPPLGKWLRAEAPLARRMHRNTRRTLREYYAQGLISEPPPDREVTDERFDYANEEERHLYTAVERYINRRFEELEAERPGKGFVMTIYRRRASSSPHALRRSLERRRDGLQQVVLSAPADSMLAGDEVSPLDFEDAGEEFVDESGSAVRVSSALPDDPAIAEAELRDVEALLARIDGLAGVDTKRDVFTETYHRIAADGRPVLVFTEAADTMEYLRDWLFAWLGQGLATYSGRGGERWNGTRWEHLSKQAVTQLLNSGELRAIICTDAASEGLNLQAAAALINYDLPWNPSRVEQRIGRIDRIGQKYEQVRIVNLLLEDSIDDRVYQVLEDRCSLFREYVGEMQPVLAEARRLLMGRGGSFDDLARRAAEVQQDDLSPAVYSVDSAEASPASRPALTAMQLLTALPDAELAGWSLQHFADGTVRLFGSPAGALTLAVNGGVLASDDEVVPLTPGTVLVRSLSNLLRVEGPLLPLVVESRTAGAFRTTVARWVHPEGTVEPIESLVRLEELLASWDESTPAREYITVARAEAGELADEAVRRAVAETAKRLAEARGAQVEAAKGRLARELCRYLLVRYGLTDSPSADTLNELLYREMSRPGAVANRFTKAHSLMGYPDWDPIVVSTIQAAVAPLNAARRNAVLSLTSVDAALVDPRWAALRPATAN